MFAPPTMVCVTRKLDDGSSWLQYLSVSEVIKDSGKYYVLRLANDEIARVMRLRTARNDGVLAKEKRLLSGCAHPGIVEMTGSVYVEGDFHGYACESLSVPRQHWRSLFKNGLTLGRFLLLGERLLRSIAYLHKTHGCVHADLKPDNILFRWHNGSPFPVLIDLEMAVSVGFVCSGLTQDHVAGTPAFMTPEQANGFYLDESSDVLQAVLVLISIATMTHGYWHQSPTVSMRLAKRCNLPGTDDLLRCVGSVKVYNLLTSNLRAPRYMRPHQTAVEMADAMKELRRSLPRTILAHRLPNPEEVVA